MNIISWSHLLSYYGKYKKFNNNNVNVLVLLVYQSMLLESKTIKIVNKIILILKASATYVLRYPSQMPQPVFLHLKIFLLPKPGLILTSQ